MHALADGLESIDTDVLSALKSASLAHADVVLLDFPRHTNAGDSLIWLGARQYLDRIKSRVTFQADQQWNPSARMDQVDRNTVFLLPGGGNFGDRYELHHSYRMHILESTKNNRVVQLPQTFEFLSDHALRETQRAVEQHGRVTLMWRQKEQHRAAQSLFPSAENLYCPDLAFGLGHIAPLPTPRRRPLLLERLDLESAGQIGLIHKVPADTIRTDWSLTAAERLKWWVARSPENLARCAPPLGLLINGWVDRSITRLARINFTSAQRLFSSASLVITDRLHAMILGGLMGIKTIAVDNVNGKVGAIYHDYAHRLPTIELASDASRLTELARTAFIGGEA